MHVPVSSLEDVRALAQAICQAAATPLTIALMGPLGAGKTQFVRYFADYLGVAQEEVTSPTYVLMQRYRGRSIIYHLDFYRLKSVDEVWDLGIDELFEQPVWVVIEWADKFSECLPADRLEIELQQNPDGQRWARLTATGPASREILGNLEL